MKFNYYSETDSLYIDLRDQASVDSREVQDGVVIDLDDEGKIVGIDIDNASDIVDLSDLKAKSLPLNSVAVS